jgi:hypothetical protein
MTRHDDLVHLELEMWNALATEGAAAPFYDDLLAKDVLMLLPGGTVIDDRAQVIDSMNGPPWSSFELADERVFDLTQDSAVVAYRATAVRGGVEYTALFNSTYVLEDGDWHLAIHQQTPV